MCFSCNGANPLIGQETVFRDTVWGSSFHDGHIGHSKSEFRHVRSIHMYQTNMLWRCSRRFRRYFWSKHHVFCVMYELCDFAIPTRKAAANIVHSFLTFDHNYCYLFVPSWWGFQFQVWRYWNVKACGRRSAAATSKKQKQANARAEPAGGMPSLPHGCSSSSWGFLMARSAADGRHKMF